MTLHRTSRYAARGDVIFWIGSRKFYLTVALDAVQPTATRPHNARKPTATQTCTQRPCMEC